MTQSIATSPSDTFDALASLSPDALDVLLGRRPKVRAPWWIRKGKVILVDVASTRTQLLQSALTALAGLRLSSECHGPALA